MTNRSVTAVKIGKIIVFACKFRQRATPPVFSCGNFDGEIGLPETSGSTLDYAGQVTSKSGWRTGVKNSSSKKSTLVVFGIAFVTFLVAILVWAKASRPSFLAGPVAPHNKDGMFYDNIAFNLSQGKGFVVDFFAPPWRDSYVESNSTGPDKGKYAWTLKYRGSGQTTMRPPGYPYALATIYRIFGWHCDIARIFGVLFVSLGLALLIAWSFRQWGWVAALAATVTMLVDYSIMQSPGMIASESLAILTMAVAFVMLLRAYSDPTYAKWVMAGLAFAVLMLVRSNWNLGFLLMGLATTAMVIPAVRRRVAPLQLTHLGVFFFTCVAVCLPWWIRNCQLTESFQPFGLAGANGLVAAYCDESLADHGEWQAAVYRKHRQTLQSQIDVRNRSLHELEIRAANSSTEKAKKWAIENWQSLPILMFNRFLNHWGLFNSLVPKPLQAANIALLVLGLAGCLIASGRVRHVFIFVLLIDAAIVMLTWEHMGRYAIPIRPVIHIASGLAISILLRFLTTKGRAPT